MASNQNISSRNEQNERHASVADEVRKLHARVVEEEVYNEATVRMAAR
jgi:hypothetical protein